MEQPPPEPPSDATASVICSFTTKLPQQFAIESDVYNIPADATRTELSQLINTLLQRESPEPFDFLLSGTLLYTSLADHIQVHSLSTEATLEIEYVLAVPPPETQLSIKLDDWLSHIIPSMHKHYGFLKRGTSLASCYDGSLVLFQFDNDTAVTSSIQPDGTVVDAGKRLISKKLFSTPIKTCAMVPLNHRPHIVSGGYEGRLLFTYLLEDSFSFINTLEITGLDTSIISSTVSADENTLYVGSISGTVHRFDMAHVLHKHAGDLPIDLLRSDHEPTSKRVHAGSIITYPGEVCRMLSDEGGNEDNVSVNSLSCVPGTAAHVLAGCSNNSVRLLDMAKGSLLQSFSGPASCQCVQALAPSTFLTGFHDRTVRLYDTRMGNPLAHTYVGHKSSIVSLDAAGLHFISGDVNGDINLWDQRSMVPLWTVDTFYRKRDHKRDQCRLMSCCLEDFGESSYSILSGGSDRLVSRRTKELVK